MNRQDAELWTRLVPMTDRELRQTRDMLLYANRHTPDPMAWALRLAKTCFALREEIEKTKGGAK
jgi:hypothetical protein